MGRTSPTRSSARRSTPIPTGLTIVTKVGAVRGGAGEWLPAQSPAELVAAVDDNRRNLDRDRDRRRQPADHGRRPDRQRGDRGVDRRARRGAGRTAGEGRDRPHRVEHRHREPGRRSARTVASVACVQNLYNIAHRGDDALIDELAAAGIAYVPYFPLGGFTPLQSDALAAVAARRGHSPQQVALAWLLARSANILLIPGTSSVAHLHENLAAAAIVLSAEDKAELDAI